jgi:hypothetical protein
LDCFRAGIRHDEVGVFLPYHGMDVRLEGRAKPILTPPIQDQASTLEINQQFTVLSWAAKTSMTCEVSLSENDDNFTADECSIVMQQDRPPALTQVFLAGVEGRIKPMQYAASKVRMEVKGEDVGKYHFHTIQVGALVLQVLRRVPPLAN